MTVPETQVDFQVYGSRDDMLVIPLPGQLRPPRKSTALYMISSPLPPDVEAIRFDITGHDQGWSDNPQGRTWTWFAVSILRPLAEGVGEPIHCEDIEYIKARPEDFGAQLQDSGYYSEDIITGDGVGEDQTPAISIPLVNNQLGQRWQRHSITWSRLNGRNDGIHFISLLEEGDRLAIWACAEFPGWVNYVKKASISVLSASSMVPQSSENDRQEPLIEDNFKVDLSLKSMFNQYSVMSPIRK